MNQRETIFCEDLLLKPTIKHIKKRELDVISQKTGISKPDSGHEAPPKQRTSVVSNRNLVQGTSPEVPLFGSHKAKGVYTKGFNDQTQDYNLLGISVSKKHFQKHDNVRSNGSTLEAKEILNRTAKQPKVNGYMNSDQMKNIFSQSDSKYYRGLLG